MSYNTPKEIVSCINSLATDKVNMPNKKVFVSSVLGGAYIAIGSLLAIIIAGNLPGLHESNSGIQKLLFGAVFPIGLILIAIAGGDLFTGNTAYFIPSVMAKRMSFTEPLKNWIIVYLGNAVGALLVTFLFVYYAGLIEGSDAVNFAVHIGEHKVSSSFMQTFVKGIGCNWLVALGMWLAYSAKDIAGKILGIWFPIMAFVAMGFEHSVANMFFIPTAMLNNADISFYQLFVNNLIPVTIGNIVGGALFVGATYYYLYERE